LFAATGYEEHCASSIAKAPTMDIHAADMSDIRSMGRDMKGNKESPPSSIDLWQTNQHRQKKKIRISNVNTKEKSILEKRSLF
jgi:hypothetical protein